MSNLSYCRFQNTLNDLRDCKEAMRNMSGVDKEAMDADEFNAMVRLIDECGEIYHEFEPYPTCVPDDEDY